MQESTFDINLTVVLEARTSKFNEFSGYLFFTSLQMIMKLEPYFLLTFLTK